MNKTGTTRGALYRTSVQVAVVAGQLCLIVLAVLCWNAWRGSQEEPLESAELTALAKQITARPSDAALRQRYRRIDGQLRTEYFYRQAVARRGSWLLAGAAAVLVAALCVAVDCGRKLPMPQRDSLQPGRDERRARRGRWAVGALAFVTFGGAVATAIILPGAPPGPVAFTKPVPPTLQLAVWPRFRGRGGAGVSPYHDVPTAWDGASGTGILWKTAVPLPGHSSPILWGDRVFLTGANEQTREVYCFDADTGERLWRRQVSPPGSPAEAPEVWDEGVLAAATGVTDGQRVCAIFANGDIACFDFHGRKLWAQALGPLDDGYGHASSLALLGDLVLVQLDQAGAEDGLSELLAMDIATGRVVWRVDRPVGACWSSPIVIEVGSARQIIACGDPLVIAHDPASGREIWRADLLATDQAPSPVYAGGLLYIAKSGSELLAVRPDGRGDVTKTHLLWRAEEGIPEIASPVSDGRFVFLSAGGLTCYDARTGRKLWRENLNEAFRASPTLAGGRLYLLGDEGAMLIVEAGGEYKLLARSELGEKCHASPAFAPGRIYIRGEKNLYCIGSAGK